MARIKVSGVLFRSSNLITIKARSAAFINAGDDVISIDTYGVELQPGDVFSLPFSPIAEDYYEDSVSFTFVTTTAPKLQVIQYA